jgi:hypothetical protein
VSKAPAGLIEAEREKIVVTVERIARLEKTLAALCG